jgi:hypothetical protein
MQLSANLNKINNASFFDSKSSSAFQLAIASVDWKSKAVSNKPFSIGSAITTALNAQNLLLPCNQDDLEITMVSHAGSSFSLLLNPLEGH